MQNLKPNVRGLSCDKCEPVVLMGVSYIPEICPMGGKSSVERCAQCVFFEQSKCANLIWCRADRIGKGLPPIKYS